MSTVRESRLWRWLKPAGLHFGERLHMSRVENAVGFGMADVEGCLDGTQFWIELKCEDLPPGAFGVVKPRFERGQPGWHRRRTLAGGRTFVLLQLGSGARARRYLLSGGLVPVLETGVALCELEEESLVDPTAAPSEVIKAAANRPL